ncbi:hypothetical protein, partial [Bradyrhizobium sp.]|uniref:hypothetical protein n=2 Tax=Bradyrhizobium TaxID=374 RepID=UPI002904F932
RLRAQAPHKADTRRLPADPDTQIRPKADFFNGLLEHDPEKWKPFFRKDHAQTKRKDHDAFPWKRIMI